MQSSSSFTIVRPTLPSLQSLGLLPDASSVDDSRPPTTLCQIASWQNDLAHWHRPRQSSISSTTSSCTTASSRSSSPSELECLKDLCVSETVNASPTSSRPSPNSFSLVLTTFDKANAFVVVPPLTPYVPNISSYSRSASSSSDSAKRHAERSRALLLVGPAVEYLRHPKVRIARGTRVHPYRIVPSITIATRRSSTSSSSSVLSATTSPV